MAQGGDVQHGVGGFGESVWGGAFEDESFALTHDARGEHTLRVRAHAVHTHAVHTHAAHTLCAHCTLTMFHVLTSYLLW